MREFKGKTAVVTGAASGMGRAFAERFAQEGMRVVLADVEAPALEAAVRELRQREHEVIGVRTDVRELAAVRELARRAVEAFGKVHVVCNNAGVDGYMEGPIWEATDKDWQWTFGVNFWGVVNGVRAFLPLMLAQDEEGHVVNTCSATALVTANSMYGITKHAALAFSETVYAQLKQQDAKVGISALCPGLVTTRIFEGWRNRPPELRNEASPEGTEQGRQTRRMMHERLAAQGLAPDRVADLVMEAIRDERFYVTTDSDWDERMRARAENILERRNPVVQPRA